MKRLTTNKQMHDANVNDRRVRASPQRTGTTTACGLLNQRRKTTPFIHRYAILTRNTPHHDEVTAEEPLPTTVTLVPNGAPRDHMTRLTEVKTETTDDR